jgi:hypothetical protein
MMHFLSLDSLVMKQISWHYDYYFDRDYQQQQQQQQQQHC